MKILNNKIAVVSILVFLSLIVIVLSGYMLYLFNTEEECFCEPAQALMVESEETEEVANILHVEIKGAVLAPGVYEMQDGDIIDDAVRLAGGFTDDAYTDNINLSKRVSDELVIYVFTEKEFKSNDKINLPGNNSNSNDAYTIDKEIDNKVSIITSSESTESDTGNDLVNINMASIDELITLPGIGESKAQKIIDYRTDNGYFNTIEELKNVSGIGDTTFENIKAHITV